MTYPACSPALCRDCGRPSCKSPRSLYGRGVGECAGAAGDRGCDFGAHDMNRSGDAACRRSCLQQPETLVRGLGPHRQDRLRILHPITYVIAILCFHGAARDWRQADTMQAEGARSDGGRCAGGGSAGRDVGGRGERSDKARRGPREIYCCGGVAARGVLAVSSLASRFEPGRQSKICCCSQGCCAGGFFHRSFPAREPVRVRPAAPSKEISMRAI